MTDEESSKEAISYVKAHHRELIDHFVRDIKPTKSPVSIFMAGSPGAGKTEFSKHLIDEILGAQGKIVRIDPDEIRFWLPQYIAGKAELFQGAVSVGVNKIHDYVKSKSISFLLDGTFSELDRARDNIQLSLKKNRAILIQYVFQPPEVAWKFTQEREKVEGRNIQRNDFIRQFVNSRNVVSTIKHEFGNKVQVDLIERNVSMDTYQFTFNIDNIDKYLIRKYSENDLDKLV